MTAGPVHFHGSDAQTQELMAAVLNNCGCERSPAGIVRTTCKAHLMLVRDQRALDGLLASRLRRAELVRQEMDPNA